MPSSMTLHYFDFTGRAEATRLALAYTGKDFEDHRMNFQEYGASKWAGQGLPVLDVRQRGRERERERVSCEAHACLQRSASFCRKKTNDGNDLSMPVARACFMLTPRPFAPFACCSPASDRWHGVHPVAGHA